MTGLPPSGAWGDLTTQDFEGLDPEAVIALLPVGAMEQHGPHLPLDTDSAINRVVVTRTLAKLPDDLSLQVLPPLDVGDSGEHGDFPGTLALEPETTIALWSEIGAGVARAGLRKLVLFNSHGGQTQIVDIVAQRLRRDHRMLVVRANSFDLGLPAGLIDAEERAHGIHGGMIETSMMLAIAPQRVRMDKAKDFVPLSRRLARDHQLLGTEQPVGFGWQTQDLNPEGACGDASKADAETGERLLEHLAERLALLIHELRHTPLSILRDRA